MGDKSAADALRGYLAGAGILACNDNPYLTSLSDIGCGWEDVSALIDTHELFYCKAYRKRTTYLSVQAYCLLKECRAIKPMEESAARVYDLLDQGPMDIETLKLLAGMDKKQLAKSFSFLLENLYVTAIKNGRILNRNWSTYEYGTARLWEALAEKPPVQSDPREALRGILAPRMPKSEFERLLK